MLSFAPLKIQGVVVAHVISSAQLHEPSLPSNRGWIGTGATFDLPGSSVVFPIEMQPAKS